MCKPELGSVAAAVVGLGQEEIFILFIIILLLTEIILLLKIENNA